MLTFFGGVGVKLSHPLLLSICAPGSSTSEFLTIYSLPMWNEVFPKVVFLSGYFRLWSLLLISVFSMLSCPFQSFNWDFFCDIRALKKVPEFFIVSIPQIPGLIIHGAKIFLRIFLSKTSNILLIIFTISRIYIFST